MIFPSFRGCLQNRGAYAGWSKLCLLEMWNWTEWISGIQCYGSFEPRTIKLWGHGPCVWTYNLEAEVRKRRKKLGQSMQREETARGAGGTELGRQQGRLPGFSTAFLFTAPEKQVAQPPLSFLPWDHRRHSGFFPLKSCFLLG